MFHSMVQQMFSVDSMVQYSHTTHTMIEQWFQRRICPKIMILGEIVVVIDGDRSNSSCGTVMK